MRGDGDEDSADRFDVQVQKYRGEHPEESEYRGNGVLAGWPT